MEKIRRAKTNAAVRIPAYILMLAALLIAVFSAVAAGINISGGWYTKSAKAVERSIYTKTAYHAADLIYDYTLFFDSPAEMEESLRTYGQVILEGESDDGEFGYAVYEETEGEPSQEPVRIINGDLISSEDAYSVDTLYSGVAIDVYLGDVASGSVPDDVASVYEFYENVYAVRYAAIWAGAGSFICFAVLFLFLVRTSGPKEGRGGLLKYVPADAFTAAAAIAAAFTVTEIYVMIGYFDNYDATIAGIAVMTVTTATICLIYFMVMAAKARVCRLWEYSVIFIIAKQAGKAAGKLLQLIRSIPLIWKTAVILFVCMMLDLMTMAISAAQGYVSGLWIIYWAAMSCGVIYVALGMRKLREGAARLAEGDMDYKTDKKGLVLGLADHADALNSISDRMAETLEEKVKSERFKTELITNVSHDINTPLTSIINYVDFLKKENIDNENVKQYTEVLDRQSKRLKRLTEDIMEASKAATGNIKINMEPCRVGVLMTQIMGEYQEKAEKKDLKLIMKICDDDAEIMADGQRMWRVLNNLLNNICKYSQPGTRVYQSLEKENGRAVITYKNTSAYELDIDGKDLTERFVQGDMSRHSEGSGLGLSIARDLVELQGGDFHIHIDGDLFKVTMEFDLIM